MAKFQFLFLITVLTICIGSSQGSISESKPVWIGFLAITTYNATLGLFVPMDFLIELTDENFAEMVCYYNSLPNVDMIVYSTPFTCVEDNITNLCPKNATYDLKKVITDPFTQLFTLTYHDAGDFPLNYGIVAGSMLQCRGDTQCKCGVDQEVCNLEPGYDPEPVGIIPRSKNATGCL